MNLDAAGRDAFGRQIHQAFAPDFPALRDVAFPEGKFVLLLAGPTRDLDVDALYMTAELLLDRGAVYVLCWGKERAAAKTSSTKRRR
ncbi:MAG TPA: hypothetical protein VEK57_17635 [Thermoanaerobaculia bacterium]|nr:hypothetical protein [Thermoanaerobaculia bacterium]